MDRSWLALASRSLPAQGRATIQGQVTERDSALGQLEWTTGPVARVRWSAVAVRVVGFGPALFRR